MHSPWIFTLSCVKYSKSLIGFLNESFSKSPFQLAGVASGATRAALTQHFALQNNAADISAKVNN